MSDQESKIQKRHAGIPATPERTRSRLTFIPPTDIYEKSNGILLVADMPGVDEKSIDITLEENVLTITGHVDEATFEGHTLVHREYRQSDYERLFRLSETIDRDRIEATVKDGVLRLILPKAEEAKPRTISVKAG